MTQLRPDDFWYALPGLRLRSGQPASPYPAAATGPSSYGSPPRSMAAPYAPTVYPYAVNEKGEPELDHSGRPVRLDKPIVETIAFPDEEEPTPPARPSRHSLTVPVTDPMGNVIGTEDIVPEPEVPYDEQMRRLGKAAADGARYAGWFIDGTVRTLANGATNGTADNLAANLNTGFGYLGDYDAELAAQRARTKEFADAHPDWAWTADLVGRGAATYLLARSGAISTRAIAPRLPPGGRLASSAPVIMGGVIPATYGSTTQFIKTDGPMSERMRAAAFRGAQDAVLGVAGSLGRRLPIP